MEWRTVVDGQATADTLAGDRGLHYGDGVFETIAWHGGGPRFFERHLARLAHGCAVLGIEPPTDDVLSADLEALAPGDEPCVLKLLVTRGDGARGYRPPPQAQARRIWQCRPWPGLARSDYVEGVNVVWLDTRLSAHATLAGIKHLARLEQVLAARELAEHDGVSEGLVCEPGGAVIEAVSANVFATREGVLLTPRLDVAGVAGVMRGVVLDKARELDIDAGERALRRADFARADEVFLTSAVRGIVPVRRIGKLRYSVGEVARRVSAALADDGVVPCG